MLTAVIFILVLGLLIFVHELGHFLVARRNGVAVEEFGFGFPPRIIGLYKAKKGQRKIVWGSRDVKREIRETGRTVYSVNWIPLGGFVKITGEDGEERNNPESFASKPPFVRARILIAGVAMNFLLAAILFSIGFWMGVPQPVEEVKDGKLGSEKIQIVDVGKDTPAEMMGIRAGDEILGALKEGKLVKFSSVEEVQNFIGGNRGSRIDLVIQRGREKLEISGVPRIEFPENEGSLGIGLAKIVVVKYPWYKAIVLGFQYTFDLTITLISFLSLLIWRLIIGQPVGLDVSGPVGIVVLTGQVAQLGLDYLIRFTGMLSVNLAIINALPIPALDGGRILFILIEKLKGSPVSKEIEQRAHNFGFAFLITLMLFVTIRDFMRFDLVEKIRSMF